MSALLLVFFLTGGIASANRVFLGFGFFPPIIVAQPSAIMVPSPAYYPYPYGYYGPGYYGDRVWVRGSWDAVWTGRGWERVWIPGHWGYWS